LFLSLVVLAVAACRKPQSPDQAYEQIQFEMRHSELDAALSHVDQAYDRYSANSEKWAWSFRVLKAQIFVYRREYKKALEILAAPLPSSLESTETGVRKHLVEGIAYRWAQQFEKSQEQFNLAATIAEKYQPRLLAEVLNSKGGLELDENKYSEAELTFNGALQRSRQFNNHFQEASALASLGVLATRQEHFGQAIDWDRAGLKLAEAFQMRDTAAVIVGNLGWSYFSLGDFENALLLFKQAAEEAKNKKLYDYEAHWLTSAADAYYAQHDYASARGVLATALDIARGLDEKSALTECLNDLSEVALETGGAEAAERYNNEALEVERAGLDQSGIQESQLITARIEARKRQYNEAAKLLEGLITDPKTETALKWEAEARLAKVLDDQGKTVEAGKEYQKAIGTIEAARASVTEDDFRLTFISGGIEFYQDYVDFLVGHGRTEDALRVAELSRARTLTEGLASTSQAASLNTRNLRPQEISQKMMATLLFYWVGQRRSHLWAITPAGTNHFDLPKAAEVEPLARSYRDAVLRVRDAQDADGAAGKQLYAMLVAPAGKLIPTGSHVIVLPDASLAALNFETLIAPEPQAHFWIEDVTVTTASSLTLLAASTARAPSKDMNLLLVGDTVQPNEDFPALPQAPVEMKILEGYFPAARRQVLEGAQATPSAYLASKPERFAYLHFVTHGTASVTRPLESAVILSKEGDSYKLYARDILKHPLTAQLVTISACEGAGKQAYSGEGLVGLSWAFLRAGAHHVVGALWEVSDASTPEFMDTFYRELGKGRDPASALRAAKLGLLHPADPGVVFRRPYYWATFQLYAGS
jgi:CHAT domain-containing protein